MRTTKLNLYSFITSNSSINADLRKYRNASGNIIIGLDSYFTITMLTQIVRKQSQYHGCFSRHSVQNDTASPPTQPPTLCVPQLFI
jgi:hypothetical protein